MKMNSYLSYEESQRVKQAAAIQAKANAEALQKAFQEAQANLDRKAKQRAAINRPAEFKASRMLEMRRIFTASLTPEQKEAYQFLRDVDRIFYDAKCYFLADTTNPDARAAVINCINTYQAAQKIYEAEIKNARILQDTVVRIWIEKDFQSIAEETRVIETVIQVATCENISIFEVLKNRDLTRDIAYAVGRDTFQNGIHKKIQTYKTLANIFRGGR